MTPRTDTGPQHYNWTFIPRVGETHLINFHFVGETNATCKEMSLEVVIKKKIFKTVCFPKSSSESHMVSVSTFKTGKQRIVVRHAVKSLSPVKVPNFFIDYFGECEPDGSSCSLFSLLQRFHPSSF